MKLVRVSFDMVVVDDSTEIDQWVKDTMMMALEIDEGEKVINLVVEEAGYLSEELPIID